MYIESPNKLAKPLSDTNYDHLFHFAGGHKAGMQDMDRKKQSEIIYEMSRNSLYFKNAIGKDSKTDEKISAMSTVISSVKQDLPRLNELRSKVLNDLSLCESKRNLGRICCVLDMDMFFAAVEIRDKPDLVDKPVAVGGNDMICTANYIARKFGVRSAMPGFIAKKLCPHLVFISPNFHKYQTVSEIIKAIVKEYDANFRSMSLDEVYVDLTDVSTERMCREIGVDCFEPSPQFLLRRMQVAEEVVNEIRLKIAAATGGLTASAGVAVNFLLAKIAADVKKPDGQHTVPPVTKDILAFITNLSVRKVPGIGKVTEKILNALDVKTVGDIHSSLPLLLHGSSSIQYHFFLHTCIGISREEVDEDSQAPDNTDSRKSLGASRTFPASSSQSAWTAKLREISEIVGSEMTERNLRARTVTLKIKSAAFEESTRRRTFVRPIQLAEDIFETSCKLLGSPWPQSSLRLLGITLSSFEVRSASPGISRFFKFKTKSVHNDIDLDVDGANVQSCIPDIHSESVVQPYDTHVSDICNYAMAQEYDADAMKCERKETDLGALPAAAPASPCRDETGTSSRFLADRHMSVSENNDIECPVCGLRMMISVSAANLHVNACLSRLETSEPDCVKGSDQPSGNQRKRKGVQLSFENFVKRR